MYHQPTTLAEALELRAKLGETATVINGGTDVVVAMNHGGHRPQAFLDLSRVSELQQVRREGDTLLLGAGVTFAQLGRLHLRALREASLSVAGPALRNMGTIGGNLVTASPAGDGCVALLAMNAVIELTSTSRGVRRLPVREFFISYRKTELASDELVTCVRAPYNPQSRWYKIGKRGAVNISLVCCAISRNPGGRFGVAFGCVGPVPMFAPKTEAVLASEKLTDEIIERAADTAFEEVAPIDDFRASAAYRRAMCKVLTRRLLRALACSDAKGGARGDADA